ncbi:MAG: ArnT family glycosyltransferase [Candidatus Heimdallarchaeota archaeon]
MNPESNSLRKESAILILILISSFIFYLYILTRYPLIYGIDGPYYLIQVRSLLESGRLKYGDPPLAFLIFTFFTLIVGGDITLGIRVGLAIFSALTALPLYLWMKQITHSPLSGYVAMVACIFSAPHIRLMNDLLKNSVGAFFLLCFIYYLHCSSFNRTKKSMFFAAFFLILTGATHILDFGVALLFLFLYPLIACFIGEDWKSIVKTPGILSLVVLVFAISAFVVFPSFFTDFYKGLAFLRDLFTETSETNPMGFIFEPSGGLFIIPILATGVVLSFYEWRTKKRETALAISTVTIVGVFLSLPFIPQEWLWRFLLMEFIPIAFVLGFAVSKIKRKLISAIFLLLCLLPLVLQGVATSKTIKPTIREVDYHELEFIGSFIPSNSVIVGDLRLGYWVQYITNCNIAKKLSHELWENYEHVLILIDKLSLRVPPIPPGATKIIEAKHFVLYELRPPPPFCLLSKSDSF